MSHVNIFFFFPLALHLLASLGIWGGGGRRHGGGGGPLRTPLITGINFLAFILL